MMMFPRVSLLLAGATAALAQSDPTVLQSCPSNGLCYKLNIPDSTAQSGSGSIFFQISSPTTNTWAAIAQGSAMDNSNMFVMYTSADGKNVTVSPRTATGEVMPTHDTDVSITLLEGSGISSDGNTMTANVRCDNCSSWSGGTLDYKGSSSTWLYAARAGSAMKTDDLDATIQQHGAHGQFKFATQQAIGGSSTNPFVVAAAAAASSPSSPAANNTTTAPSSGGAATTTQSPSDNDSSGTASTGGFSALSPDTQNRMITAHGSLATIAFVALFPLGAVLMRLGRIANHRAWIHGGTQLVAYLVFVAGAALGIYIARGSGQLQTAHAGIGVFLLAFVAFLPVAGALAHSGYKKQGRRGFVGVVHSWSGRLVILLGIVNGGLGLQLSGAENGAIIAYGVIAGLVGLGVLALAGFAEVGMAKAGREGRHGEK